MPPNVLVLDLISKEEGSDAGHCSKEGSQTCNESDFGPVLATVDSTAENAEKERGKERNFGLKPGLCPLCRPLLTTVARHEIRPQRVRAHPFDLNLWSVLLHEEVHDCRILIIWFSEARHLGSWAESLRIL